MGSAYVGIVIKRKVQKISSQNPHSKQKPGLLSQKISK